jgi:ferredoxin-NADP reductase
MTAPMSVSTHFQPAVHAVTELDLGLVVRDRRVVADGVLMLDLGRPNWGRLPTWDAGAHVDLVLTGQMVRQYSLCGDPGESAIWRVAVLHEPDGRGGSDHIHSNLHVDTTVRVRGPRNHFPLVPAQRYLFIAGGIGITPIVPMLAAVSRTAADWTLLYGGRSLSSMAFADDLCSRYGRRVTLWPQDTHGLPDLDALLGDPDLADGETLIYCCGPEPLLEAVENRCDTVPRGVLHVERFSPGELAQPALDGAFEVQIDSTGEIFSVGPDQSILGVLRDAGVYVDASCEEGTCGTCETPVLDGAVDHRDFVLSEDEREDARTMMVCVSRAACPRIRIGL